MSASRGPDVPIETIEVTCPAMEKCRAYYARPNSNNERDELNGLTEKARAGNGIARREVAEALADLGEPAVELLITLLKDPADAVRGAAATALCGIPDVRAIGPLIETLHDWDHHICTFASDALAAIGEPAVEALLAQLGEPGWKVRCAAARALGHIGDKRAVAPLIAALHDDHSMTCMTAAGALGRIGSVRALTPLMAILRDGSPSVRREAAGALALIGGPALLLLRDATGDPAHPAHKEATQALRDAEGT